MKKIFALILLAVCFLSACGSQKKPQSPDVGYENSVFTEEDIISMFTDAKIAREYIACSVISDRASGRVGAVLFCDDASGDTSVAYFDADGDFQKCQTSARLADEPDFRYIGDGTVTFKLLSSDGTVYSYTLTLRSENGNIYFTAFDDLGNDIAAE